MENQNNLVTTQTLPADPYSEYSHVPVMKIENSHRKSINHSKIACVGHTKPVKVKCNE